MPRKKEKDENIVSFIQIRTNEVPKDFSGEGAE